ncbi:helix-turn-helix domain-containing protein [Nakamurella sp. A5-74]|uniref:Helix-turn-helix domain-containing protein n=1 Tax=Nakamurella sp. A5-74 TaxID=3158264 RepID=A0AAU8DJD3_9ACTN
MTGQRKYGQACPVAHALDLVGDRWALLVVRELRLGPRRFGDLATALPGIAPSVLTQRLGELVEVGVLERLTLSSRTGAVGYGLTAWGADLEPVFMALARWGVRSPVVPLAGPISDDAVMLGVRTFFPAAPQHTAEETVAATGLSGDVLVELTHERYLLRLADGALESLARLAPGEDVQYDARVRTDGNTLRALLVGTLSATAASVSGAVATSGDLALGHRLVDSIARRS